MSSNREGAGFVIRDSDSRLIAACRIHLGNVIVLSVEVQAAWVGIMYARLILGTNCIVIEGDSTIMVGWIQGQASATNMHPLLLNIWGLVREYVSLNIRQVYYEANYIANRVASLLWSI